MLNPLRNMARQVIVSVLLTGFFGPVAIAQSRPRPWKDSASLGKIGYVQPDAKLVQVPPVQGDRYEDMVPDTPDAAEMSKLAIRALTCATNPLQDHEQYFNSDGEFLDVKDGELKVNMLINRASPWADVYSFIPYQGRVEIKMKQTCSRVLVHTPEWIEPGSSEIQATVDGSPRPVTWEGKYLCLGEVKAKQRIAITCPITERVVKEKMGLEMYTLLVRGNTVVGIDPPGRICPLFQRDYMRNDQPRWLKVERFVTDKPFDY